MWKFWKKQAAMWYKEIALLSPQGQADLDSSISSIRLALCPWLKRQTLIAFFAPFYLVSI